MSVDFSNKVNFYINGAILVLAPFCIVFLLIMIAVNIASGNVAFAAFLLIGMISWCLVYSVAFQEKHPHKFKR